MNNKSLSLPPPSLSLFLSLSLRSNASLTLLPINPPSFTLTHSLHLLREHEPAAVSASLSVSELTYVLPLRPSNSFAPLHLSKPSWWTSSAHPGQQGERRPGPAAKKTGHNNRKRKWAVTCVRGDCGQASGARTLFLDIGWSKNLKGSEGKRLTSKVWLRRETLDWLFYLCGKK